ncbi:FadR/GntR family transcriptional regulator [Frondihabitans australicus]|uniref:GntR family transcriptional regulator n=1 Tax=Frondihabitans australicus TaxID=386892 RepID=A0A495IN43_9MICO|nr:FCD domain-containing protein [Frondihabitans australicus]RKR76601.1 GntR family transcriptional regulator [Frondihabitans australicus]
MSAHGNPVGADVGGRAFARVLETVGPRIVRGALPAGTVTTVDALVAETGASRSIVREATRVLVSLGLLSAGRRVGLRVLPATDWNVLDPAVIAWRLDSPDRPRQLDELRQLRAAVEPEAARLAALRRTDTEADQVAGAARDLEASDPAGYLDADRRLHALVLAASGNGLFARLTAVVDAALEDRALRERPALAADPYDVALHVAVAAAVVARDADAAARLMREIVDRTA